MRASSSLFTELPRALILGNRASGITGIIENLLSIPPMEPDYWRTQQAARSIVKKLAP
jgi:hypothetical protein